jgi:hypothetical protein
MTPVVDFSKAVSGVSVRNDPGQLCAGQLLVDLCAKLRAGLAVYHAVKLREPALGDDQFVVQGHFGHDIEFVVESVTHDRGKADLLWRGLAVRAHLLHIIDLRAQADDGVQRLANGGVDEPVVDRRGRFPARRVGVLALALGSFLVHKVELTAFGKPEVRTAVDHRRAVAAGWPGNGDACARCVLDSFL